MSKKIHLNQYPDDAFAHVSACGNEIEFDNCLTFSLEKVTCKNCKQTKYYKELLKAKKMNEPICETDKYGNKSWYLNGKRHRENGPAVEYANGNKYWFLNGKLHRENGPAIEYANGTKEWFLNGNCHRENGPAIEYADGTKKWFLNDSSAHQSHKTNLQPSELTIGNLFITTDNSLIGIIINTNFLTTDNILMTYNPKTMQKEWIKVLK